MYGNTTKYIRTLDDLINAIKLAQEDCSEITLYCYFDEINDLIKDLENAKKCRDMLSDKGESLKNGKA